MLHIDKADEYLICGAQHGRGSCGGRIAHVIEESGHRVLETMPGWDRGDDGVWHEPPHDAKRRWDGHSPRRLPRSITGGAPNRGPSLFRPLFPFDGSPIRLRCSDCNTVHPIRLHDFGFANSEGSVNTQPNS